MTERTEKDNNTNLKTSDREAREAGKGIWSSLSTEVKNGIRYGKKTFCTEYSTVYCVPELICRHYLKAAGFTHVTYSGDITPAKINEFFSSITVEMIKDDFDSICNRLEKTIMTLEYPEVSIEIEYGEGAHDIINDYARNYVNHEDEIKNIIKELFSVLSIMHKNRFVHADLKPNNFVYVTRNNKKTLVLNDFDISFITVPGSDYHIDGRALYTIPYTAPEHLGLFGSAIGSKTDIYVAGLICYKLLNDNQYPEEINILYEKYLDKHGPFRDYDKIDFEEEATELYEEMIEKGTKFSEPRNGAANFKAAIMEALILDPDKRPTAEDILEKLNEKTENETNCSACNNVHVNNVDNSQKNINNISAGDNSPVNINVYHSEHEQKADEPKKPSLIFVLPIIIVLLLVVIAALVVISINNAPANSKTTNIQNVYNGPIIDTATDSVRDSAQTNPAENGYENETTVSVNTVNETSAPITQTTASVKDPGINNNLSEKNKTVPSHTETEAPSTAAPPTTSVDDLPPVTSAAAALPISPFDYEYESKTIIGGDYYDDVNGIVITGFSGDLPEDLVIPDQINGEKVISVGDDAFSGCKIRSLVIPDTVFEIGARAFRSCPYLSHIRLGRNVYIIGEQAFFNSQFSGDGIPTIVITNLNHGNEDVGSVLGKQWDGRAHDYEFKTAY